MRTIEGFVVALGLVAVVGCQSVTPTAQPAPVPVVVKAVAVKPVVPPAPVVSAVGKQVQALVAAAGDRRVEFFTTDGKPLEQMAEGAAGSVSIHAPDGQDNYTFDATGKVTKHLRSAGANYAAGVWEAVP